MSKITYSSLKLKLDNKVNKIENTDIEVLQYLPIEDKVALINIALQNAKEGSIYNATLLDAFFHLYIVIMYSNISFTEKQKEDPMKLYDILKSNGLIDKVILAMDENEYNNLTEFLNQQLNDIYNYKNTIGGILSDIVDNLPVRAEEMQKIIDNFDKEKFQEVLNFAKSVNNGKDI